ncbi:MAG: hypothetical protein MK185_10285 [Saccharospirillaceae bacterium]|nr:hypothetical protein A3759_13775 [Thalassolituus sp. HI0120]KZZ47462.1 hypothetical protein A3759_29900 [Thalassolituus sp. HI0120]MCH2041008.1 hypothetical protein [Saccharospirillaceae bacterium]
MKKLAVLLLSFAASLYANAEVVKIKNIGCDTSSGTCFILLEEPYKSLDCQHNNSQIRFNHTSAGFKNQWPIVIAAFLAEKPLHIFATSCYETQPTPAYLYMSK